VLIEYKYIVPHSNIGIIEYKFRNTETHSFRKRKKSMKYALSVGNKKIELCVLGVFVANKIGETKNESR
jgi:hypothetical protein